MKEETKNKYIALAEEWLHNGEHGTNAYQRFYPDASKQTAGVNSYQILNLPEIKEYIEKRRVEMRAEAEHRHGVTRYSLIDDQKKKKLMMNALYELANKEDLDPKELERFERLSSLIKTSDINKADEILIKMLGLFDAEKIDIKSGGEKVESVFIIGGKEVKF